MATDIKQIFEYELKRKISMKAKRSSNEPTVLINHFKFNDVNNTGIADKSMWVKTIMNIGLNGFSDQELGNLFDVYDVEKTGALDYKAYAFGIYNQQIPVKSPVQPIKVQRNVQQVSSPFARSNKRNQCSNGNPLTFGNSNDFSQLNQNYVNQRPNVQSPNIQQMQNINPQQQIPQNYSQSSQKELEETQKFIDQRLNKQPLDLNVDYCTTANVANPNEYMPPKTPMKMEIRDYFKYLLNQCRQTVNVYDGLVYYDLLSKLKEEENPYSHQISYDILEKAFTELKLTFTGKQLKDLFFLLDLGESGQINAGEFLSLIRGQLNNKRRMLLVNTFAKMDPERKGAISTQKILNDFKPEYHPDCESKKATPQEVWRNFNYTFEIFCKYKGVKDVMLLQDFVEYYEGISASIPDDDYFIETIYKVWNLSSNDLPLEKETIPSENGTLQSPSTGKDSNAKISLADLTIKKIRSILSLRGTKAIFGLLRFFKLFDKENKGELTFSDFAQLSNIYKLELSGEEINSLFTGETTNYDLLIKSLCGELNEIRRNAVFATFRVLDKRNLRIVNIELMKQAFNPSRHPDVLMKRKTKDEILAEFLDILGIFLEYKGKNYDATDLSIEEFVEFFTYISLGILDDAFFEGTMVGCWDLDLN